jgi:hypothetical protein
LYSWWEHRKNNNILFGVERMHPTYVLEAKAWGEATSDNEHQCPSEAMVMLLGSANIGQKKCAFSTCTCNKAPTTNERESGPIKLWRMPWRF